MMNPQGQPTPQGRMTTPQQGGQPAPTGGPTAGGSPTPTPTTGTGTPQTGTPTTPMGGGTTPMSTTPGQVQAAKSRMGTGTPPMGAGTTMGSALGLTKPTVPGMGVGPSGIPTLPPNVFTNSDVLKEAKKDLGDSRRFKDFEFMLKKYSKKKR